MADGPSFLYNLQVTRMRILVQEICPCVKSFSYEFLVRETWTVCHRLLVKRFRLHLAHIFIMWVGIAEKVFKVRGQRSNVNVIFIIISDYMCTIRNRTRQRAPPSVLHMCVCYTGASYGLHVDGVASSLTCQSCI